MEPEKSIPVIDNWACVCSEEHAFLPPELKVLLIKGTVTGHPKYPDGKRIQTSCIRRADGKIVYTQNSIYKLGEPRKDWLDWMEENGIKFDPENPIKIK